MVSDTFDAKLLFVSIKNFIIRVDSMIQNGLVIGVLKASENVESQAMLQNNGRNMLKYVSLFEITMPQRVSGIGEHATSNKSAVHMPLKLGYLVIQ